MVQVCKHFLAWGARHLGISRAGNNGAHGSKHNAIHSLSHIRRSETENDVRRRELVSVKKPCSPKHSYQGFAVRRA